jgi:(+)-trans-carveol dehydrogenase
MTEREAGTTRFTGKNVVVTGAARGQGRNHVVRFAAEGANIVAVDMCADVASISYPLATADEFADTVATARDHGVKVHDYVVDVRDGARLREVLDDAAAALGGFDVVSVNAGIASAYATVEDTSAEAWDDVIGVNLSGAFNTARAVIPHVRRRGGGSITFTASVAGLQGMANLGGYVASKHGVVGLMRTMAIELAADNIRVNALMPTSVATPMLMNDPTYRLMRPDLDDPQLGDVIDVLRTIQLLPVPYVEIDDVTEALLWLSSDAARMITGVALPVDGGALLR